MEDLLKAGDYDALAERCEQEELKVSVVQASEVTDDGWQMQKLGSVVSKLRGDQIILYHVAGTKWSSYPGDLWHLTRSVSTAE